MRGLDECCGLCLLDACDRRYRVDRQKSVDVLKAFLEKKDVKLEEERRWLTEIKADCVLSDAAFLGW